MTKIAITDCGGRIQIDHEDRHVDVMISLDDAGTYVISGSVNDVTPDHRGVHALIGYERAEADSFEGARRRAERMAETL